MVFAACGRLLNAIKNRTAKIAVFGQGYVGLPLAVSFACADFEVIGVDVNRELVDSLNEGVPSAMDYFVEDNLERVVRSGRYLATTDGVKAAGEADVCIVCVPTPLNYEDKPNLDPVRDAVETISRGLSSGKLLIVESSTYPGSIEEIAVPVIEEAGFRVGGDVGLAHCPERVDPRNKVWTIHNTCRVVGAVDEGSLRTAKALYQVIMTAPLIEVRNIRTAEAVKELENTFRLVNISLANDFAMYCEKFGLDAREVIEAASTKPFGFLAHYPGPGAGGHCIPKDPVYLLESGRKVGVEMKLIETALEVNKSMIDHVVSLVKTGFDVANRHKNDGIVLVVGLSYKEDVDDLRDSSGTKIADRLVKDGFRVKVFEPHLKEERLERLGFEYVTSLDSNDLKDVVCLCIVQFHSIIRHKLNRIVRKGKIPIIVDCKNMLPKKEYKDKVVLRLGSALPTSR